MEQFKFQCTETLSRSSAFSWALQLQLGLSLFQEQAHIPGYVMMIIIVCCFYFVCSVCLTSQHSNLERTRRVLLESVVIHLPLLLYFTLGPHAGLWEIVPANLSRHRRSNGERSVQRKTGAAEVFCADLDTTSFWGAST